MLEYQAWGLRLLAWIEMCRIPERATVRFK